MDKITLQNYRCFREDQSARLAPLTFLVGGNSAGKTSFLALIRALWDVAFAEEVPYFREEPYNLGSFREIAHSRGGRGSQADSFEAGFEYAKQPRREAISFQAVFEERLSDPFPCTRCYRRGETWVEMHDKGAGQCIVQFGDSSAKEYPSVNANLFSGDETRLVSLRGAEFEYRRNFADPENPRSIRARRSGNRGYVESHGTGEPSVDGVALANFRELVNHFRPPINRSVRDRRRPFASAPVRSRPLRTYDPTRLSADPEGGYVPTYLANVYHRDNKQWQSLKIQLEKFGQASGLFNEISIKSFGKSEGTPFQVQVRKFSERGRRGPQRNLIDVGYGVSQALPLLTELLRADASDMFLLQQPEVHLHPTAQAALGSLFCAIAESDRQLIVETHSDYILDRVFMDIRDKTTKLKPEDVSILYFEPGDLDVKIHSIRLDEYGNILDAPPSYRQFFMEETRRSIGL